MVNLRNPPPVPAAAAPRYRIHFALFISGEQGQGGSGQYGGLKQTFHKPDPIPERSGARLLCISFDFANRASPVLVDALAASHENTSHQERLTDGRLFLDYGDATIRHFHLIVPVGVWSGHVFLREKLLRTAQRLGQKMQQQQQQQIFSLARRRPRQSVSQSVRWCMV